MSALLKDTAAPRGAASANGLSAPQGIWLVAEREIGSKLRSKAFVISTAILTAAAPVLLPTRVCSIHSFRFSMVNSMSHMSR